MEKEGKKEKKAKEHRQDEGGDAEKQLEFGSEGQLDYSCRNVEELRSNKQGFLREALRVAMDPTIDWKLAGTKLGAKVYKHTRKTSKLLALKCNHKPNANASANAYRVRGTASPHEP